MKKTALEKVFWQVRDLATAARAQEARLRRKKGPWFEAAARAEAYESVCRLCGPERTAEILTDLQESTTRDPRVAVALEISGWLFKTDPVAARAIESNWVPRKWRKLGSSRDQGAIARKREAKMAPEKRSERSRRGHETRRAKHGSAS